MPILCPQIKRMEETERKIFEARLLHAIRYDSNCFEQAVTLIMFAETFTNVYDSTKIGNDAFLTDEQVESIFGAAKVSISNDALPPAMET